MTGRLGTCRAAQIWAALILVLAAAGCGGATTPCPTPTTELDRLRSESERLEQDLDRAAGDERSLRAEREEAAQRIGAAEVALDSLAQGRTP